MGQNLAAMARWLAVALVLLSCGCICADAAEPLVQPLNLLQQDSRGPANTQAPQDPGEVAAAKVEAQVKEVEEQAETIEKGDQGKSAPKMTDALPKPAPATPVAPAAEVETPSAADTIAEPPREAAAVEAA